MRLEGWSGEQSESTEFSFDDDLISELIYSARAYIEECANVSLIPHEFEVVLTNMGGTGGTRLPFSPIGDVSSIIDSNGDEIDQDLIEVRGNNEKYLYAPSGYDLTVTYTTSALKDSRPLVDIKTLVWAMYNERTKDPAEIKLNLWIDSYSRKSVVS